MAKGHIKQVFPGGNTAKGFVSFYDYLCFPKRNKIFVMKGGPGVGKSTFMRQIGTSLAEAGFDVEFHNCSSDNGSLDGVYIPSIGVGILDGTAPHVVDPKHPGAVDEIVHLGDYWDEPAMRKNTAGVVAGFTENARLFRCAYANLASAKVHLDEYEAYYKDLGTLNISGLNGRTRELIGEIFGNQTASAPGPERHLFGSALSPKGPVNFLDTVYGPMEKRYIIKGDYGTGKSTIVGKIFNEAVSRGFYVEAYHCPLTSDHLEHLVIPELSVAVLTSVPPHVVEPDCHILAVDTSEFVDADAIVRVKGDMDEARTLYQASMDRAVGFISRAKANHDALETFYIPNIDFAKVSARRDDILGRILELAEIF